MINREILEMGERLLEKDLQRLFSKPELSAADWDAVKKAMCVASMMSNYGNGESYDEEGRSYGYGNRRSYGHMPDPYYGYEEPMGRMRSPVTGRYISGGMDGYSGHSIEDRMIMALEQQMDSAKTDYERQMVEKEIQRIRRGDK